MSRQVIYVFYFLTENEERYFCETGGFEFEKLIKNLLLRLLYVQFSDIEICLFHNTVRTFLPKDSIIIRMAISSCLIMRKDISEIRDEPILLQFSFNARYFLTVL